MKKFIGVMTILALPCLMLAQEVSSPKTGAVSDGSVLPFPEPPSASVTGKTLADSKHKWQWITSIAHHLNLVARSKRSISVI